MESTEPREAQQEGDAAARLRSFAVRIVSRENDKQEIAADIKALYKEAAGVGFDRTALKVVVARIRETDDEREIRTQTEVLAQLYLASLGMLDGTPLGDAARRRFDPPPERDPFGLDDGEGNDSRQAGPDDAAEEVDDAPARAPPAGAMGEEELAGAREAGSDAAASGRRIYDNPFVAGDPRRALWDEGWCARKGSDGMEIPDAWKRPAKRKPADGAEPGDGAQP